MTGRITGGLYKGQYFWTVKHYGSLIDDVAPTRLAGWQTVFVMTDELHGAWRDVPTKYLEFQ